jgi:hypothetical protein
VIGKCLCRRVSIELAHPPSHINACNCDFCRRLGAAWGYYKPSEVTIDGTTASYRRDDLDDVWLEAHFCPHCGSTTHYEVIREGHDGIAVNTRILDQADLAGIEVRYLDGKQVEDDEGEYVRTAIGSIGDGHSF